MGSLTHHTMPDVRLATFLGVLFLATARSTFLVAPSRVRCSQHLNRASRLRMDTSEENAVRRWHRYQQPAEPTARSANFDGSNDAIYKAAAVARSLPRRGAAEGE